MYKMLCGFFAIGRVVDQASPLYVIINKQNGYVPWSGLYGPTRRQTTLAIAGREGERTIPRLLIETRASG
jgi:hypothetical protein